MRPTKHTPKSSTSQWTTFHQKEELTTRIHNILQDYPPGIGPFKEFLQNADDAQAKVFSLILDESEDYVNLKRDGEGLLTKELENWQGPSLLIYDSASFSDNDFANITRLGKSEKNEDLTRIGK
jgi:sacsin